MASEFFSKVLFRFVLPLALLSGCITRYNGFSACYMLFLLIIPLLPSPCRENLKLALKLQSTILAFSLVFIFSHIIFQIVLLSYQPYGHFLKTCSLNADITEQVGLYRFDNCAVKDIIRLLAPDVIVFICSLIAVLSARHLTVPMEPYSSDLMQATSEPITTSTSRFEYILPIFGALLLLLAGIIQPNLLSSIYFIFFLVFGICWAFHLLDHIKRHSSFFFLKILLTVYTGLHVLVLYMFQFPFFQKVLDPTTFLARLLGIPAIINAQDCSKSRNIKINSMTWPFYVYPFLIFLLYWVLAVENRMKCRKQYNDVITGRVAAAWWHPRSWSKTFKETSPLLQNNEVPQYGSVQADEPTIKSEDNEEPVVTQGTFSSIMMFLMRQSYIAALIIMMTWSIIYHSWLTFVLLLWACLTWITPFARWFCMVSSPYLVVYSTLLLLLQYVYGMNLKDSELPVKEGKFNFSELGLVETPYPVLHLAVQTLFTWVFLVTLRQHYREKRMKQRNSVASEMVLTTLTRPIFEAIKRRVNSGKGDFRAQNPDDLEHGTPSDDAKEMMAWIKSTLAKYWIVVCCFAFLLVALQNSVSLYQIFYMVIFLMGFVVYQFSLRSWKTILRSLWWFMVVYSIVILLTIYTYQFDNMHQYWSNGTHLSDQWLFDIGLRQQSKSGLLLELLIPTIFSIVIVIQLHFFHKPLMMKINRLLRYRKCRQRNESQSANNFTGSCTDQTLGQQSTISSLSTVTGMGESMSDESEDELDDSLLKRIRKMHHETTVILWRIVEIHSPHIVGFVVMLVVVQQVSAINAIFVILLAMAMPSEYLHRFLNYVMIAWSSVVVLVFMFYQLEFVKENMLDTNCTKSGNMSYPKPANGSHFVSNAWWLGFHKSGAVSRDVRGYLFIVLFIVFEKVIKHHQELYRYRKNVKSVPVAGILFDDVTRKMADDNVVTCLKYLCNHFFRLFGMEINLMVMVVCMSFRGDGVAVLHSLWVAAFLFVQRKTAIKLWRFYVPYMAVMLPLQYLLILGWPPGWCNGYPWDNLNPSTLVQWLYLTDIQKPQNQYVLIADYFQFLAACCQANVFKEEANEKKPSHSNTASNTTYEAKQEVYVPQDFTGNKTWLDFIKILVLDQFLWLSLSIVYITAQSTISIFNSGFIVGCFFFLWHGQGLYLRPRQTIKRWWKTFIAYNFFVIVVKVWLQLVSCVFVSDIYEETDCYLIQLLNLYCLRSDTYNIHPTIDCMDSNTDTGLLMDSVCFIVALIQYRIFNSTYFKYVIREHRKQSEIAYRGAQLVEERLLIRLNESIQRDKKKMQLIRTKVAKLKQRLAELNPKAQEPLSHYEAIYAGDYYLFEDSETDSDSDIKDDEEEEEERSTEGDLTTTSVPQETSEQQDVRVEKDTMEDSTLATGQEDVTRAEQTDGLRLRRPKHRKRSEQSSEISLITPENTIDQTEDVQTSCKEKLKEYLHTSSSFFKDLANNATNFLNETSKDYRYITSQLKEERKERARTQLQTEIVASRNGKTDVKNADSDHHLSTSNNKDDDDESDTWSVVPSEDEKVSWKKTDSYGVRLAVAFYYALLANTDLLCYSLMIINHMYYACVLSMPLPFFVFFWGMLSIPRPTKRFWITVITYVELVIVIKYVFQFQFPEDNNFNECEYYDVKEAKSPLCPPRIFGIERNQYSSVCDLLLLLGLFFHRFALKAHGLWREKAWSDEEDTSPRVIPNKENVIHPSEVHLLSDTSQVSTRDSRFNSNMSRASIQPKQSVLSNIKRFIQRMLDPGVGTGAVDVYAWMFSAQFIVFVIILSGWSAFSSNQESKSNFAKIIEENNVPKTFLYMLLSQFLLIVLDRFLYMKKQVLAKLIYLVILVFLFHIFLFVVVPQITQRTFTQNVPAIFMYLFQCIYFGLSAYQVRCGYPTRILGNFLTKNYTVTSGILFQGIQAIPFLLELRSVLDWVCTKTTLTLSHWLKMEDIYANVFILKCWRDSEKTWPHPRGMPYWSSSKWLIGGILVTLLIVVIWFPLLLMSFINSAYISNRPVEVTFTLTVGGYQPLFKVSTQQQYLKELKSREINSLIARIKDWNVKEKDTNWDFNKIEQGIQDYKKTGNIVRIQVISNSSAIWTISPPSRDFLIKDLESNASISLRFKYVFNREPNTTQTTIVQESVSGVTVRPMPPGDPMRQKLAKVLRSPSGDGEISIPDLFPTFMQVPASGPVKPVSWIGRGCYVNSKLILRRGIAPHLNTTQVEWWDIVQEDPKPLFSKKSGYLEIIALNDLVPPLHLSFFANKGIIGLYVGFVWLVGKFVRLFFTSISYRIMFDELPNVNRVLKLCLEIYMVRESKELKLEEDLFAKLLFLYRSPETLIKWTKYKRLKTS